MDDSNAPLYVVTGLASLLSLASVGLGLFKSLGKDSRDLLVQKLETNQTQTDKIENHLGSLERRVSDVEKIEAERRGERLSVRVAEVERSVQRIDGTQRSTETAVQNAAAEVKSVGERQEQLLHGVEELREEIRNG